MAIQNWPFKARRKSDTKQGGSLKNAAEIRWKVGYKKGSRKRRDDGSKAGWY